MKITLYFINWNDSFYLPFIKEHYGRFCQRIVMYDQYSTDGSIELAANLGFEVRFFGSKTQLNDQWYLDVKNNCWKEERENYQKADYVIVCDVDEFLELYELPWKLGNSSAPKVEGYNMISDTLPVHSIFEVKDGAPSISYSKQVIFCPRRIDEINFVHGCHQNNMLGDISRTQVCRLYHFRQIGGVDRIIQRHADYRKRMSKFNLDHKMGVHYLHSDEQKRIEWEQLKSEAKALW